MAVNPIVHVEIPAQDTAAAAKFYNKAFGWESELDTSAGIDYLIFRADGGPAGAFVELGESFKVGQPIMYLSTDNIDATLAQVEAAGGTIRLPKMEVPNNGLIAWITDPTGNVMGLFQAPGKA